MLSQVQIIQSLGEALAWFEKELEWGAPPAELRHLTGRIGELYAAMITRGQMAGAVNQRGYDVVGSDGERISVKTVTSSGRAVFNANTLDHVDRIMVLRIATDRDDGVSIETLLDIGRPDFHAGLRHLANRQIDFPVRPRKERSRSLDEQVVVAEGSHGPWLVRQYESGTIGVWHDRVAAEAAMPELRRIAATLGVDTQNGNGKPRNTRQLGASVLDMIANLGPTR